jgi:hypothetical protein
VTCAPTAASQRRGSGLHAEVRALDRLALLELGHDLADRVRGHREADADVPLRAAGGRDLGVDADDVSAVVEERAAGVARVDRRVGLDDLVDREAVGSLDLAPRPETMPSVAVRSRPNGLPMAIAVSPTWTARESAKVSGLAFLGIASRSMLRTARSLEASTPRTSRRATTRWGRSGRSRDVGADDVSVRDERALAVDEEAVPVPSLERIETTAGLACA